MKAVVIALALTLLATVTVSAQSLYGNRLASKDGKWLLPVATRLLGSTDDDHIARGSINSWDLSATPGSPVWAAAPGIVEAAGCYLYENRQWSIMQGYGCAVQIKHGNGIASQYGHCVEGSILVKRGQQVDANTQLCQVGQTGKASWPHTHFTILRNGSPVRIASLFDINQMRYCKFCKASNDPRAQVAGAVVGQPSITGQQTVQQTVIQTRLGQLATVLRQVKPEVVSMAAVGLFGLLCLLWWLGGLYERVFVVALVTSSVVVAVGVWLVMPMATTVSAETPTNAGQQSASIGGGATWKAAYGFMRKWEGGSNPRCVHDPVRTWKGVTQNTYNAWRQSKGMGQADVCTSLTEQQAEAIYYERYWLASGANNLSPATAIAHFDHAVNAGVGAAKKVLAGCGDNANCYIQGRLADYRTKGNCAVYCRAWFNRVNDLVKYLQKGA